MDWLLYSDLAVNEENPLCVNKTQHFIILAHFFSGAANFNQD